MKNALAVFVVVLAVLLSATDSAARKLRDLIPGLYGGDGITLANPPPGSPFRSHAPHFTIDSTAAINRLNEQIATEVAIFPFSSSVGGFTFAFEPTLGTFLRTTDTLGPLFAERAPTLGRGNLNVNTLFTFFKYNAFNGESLRNLQVVTRHQSDAIGDPNTREGLELDTIRIHVDLNLRVWLLSFAATYGITDRLDVGILVPIVHIDMDVKARAEAIPSPANPAPGIHTFVGGPESPNDATSGHAIGLGDIVLRAKYHLLKSQVVDIAAAVLTKLATGDKNDFLGTGDTTLRPFLVLSRTFPSLFGSSISVTPHLNVGYEFNLKHGDRSAVAYIAGFDVGTKSWTVAAELLGGHKPQGNGSGADILNAAVGLKWNPWGRLLLAANAQFPLNDTGLRSDIITTFGVEYSF